MMILDEMDDYDVYDDVVMNLYDEFIWWIIWWYIYICIIPTSRMNVLLFFRGPYGRDATSKAMLKLPLGARLPPCKGMARTGCLSNLSNLSNLSWVFLGECHILSSLNRSWDSRKTPVWEKTVLCLETALAWWPAHNGANPKVVGQQRHPGDRTAMVNHGLANPQEPEDQVLKIWDTSHLSQDVSRCLNLSQACLHVACMPFSCAHVECTINLGSFKSLQSDSPRKQISCVRQTAHQMPWCITSPWKL